MSQFHPHAEEHVGAATQAHQKREKPLVSVTVEEEDGLLQWNLLVDKEKSEKHSAVAMAAQASFDTAASGSGMLKPKKKQVGV